MSTKWVRPEIITFDFFGTVIDWRQGFKEAAGVEHEEFDRLIDIQGRLEQQSFRRYAEIVADSLVELKSISREQAQKIGDEVGYFPLYPDSKSALHRLMRIAPCAATTNSDLIHKAQILERLESMSGWTCAEELGCYKPSPAFFEKARAKLGIATAGPSWWHVSAYGDYDLEVAKKLGLTCVFVNRPHQRPGPHDFAVADLGVLADRLEAEL